MSSKLSYASIPSEIKQIANDSLGLGVLRSLFSYSHTYHLMIKISDGVFIGFALYHFQNARDVQGEAYVTGIIDCVCVATPYRREGFGTLLTFGTLRKMAAYGADRVEIMLKLPSGEDVDSEAGIPLVGSEQLLTSLGFRKLKVFEGIYAQKSRKYAYDCKLCGTKPDSCNGVLYAISGQEASANN